MDRPSTARPLIERARDTDVAAIAALHVESWRSAYAGILPPSFLDGPAVVDNRVAMWRERLVLHPIDETAEVRPRPALSPRADPDQTIVFVARSSTEIVGFACVLLDADTAHGPLLDNLHVKPSFKGRGIGRQLFDRARAAAKEASGDPRFHLWVFEANAPARRFYESLGGRRAERDTVTIAGVDVFELRYVFDTGDG